MTDTEKLAAIKEALGLNEPDEGEDDLNARLNLLGVYEDLRFLLESTHDSEIEGCMVTLDRVMEQLGKVEDILK